MVADSIYVTSPSFLEELNKVREAVRKWYGSISIEELVGNPTLAPEIKELEKLLSNQGDSDDSV